MTIVTSRALSIRLLYEMETDLNQDLTLSSCSCSLQKLQFYPCIRNKDHTVRSQQMGVDLRFTVCSHKPLDMMWLSMKRCFLLMWPSQRQRSYYLHIVSQSALDFLGVIKCRLLGITLHYSFPFYGSRLL